jgi:hypothetical protein
MFSIVVLVYELILGEKMPPKKEAPDLKKFWYPRVLERALFTILSCLL